MKKLRLLITDQCNRNCPKCCNKGFDLKALPIADPTHLFNTHYDEVSLTGGEPLLVPTVTVSVASLLKTKPFPPKVYLYTAWVEDASAYYMVMPFVDGVTVAIRSLRDSLKFQTIAHHYKSVFAGKHNRIKVFAKNLTHMPEATHFTIETAEWIDNCPLPEDEVFMRWSPYELPA